MLKQRVITALVLLAIVLWVILALPTSIIAIIFGLVVLQAAWEWTYLVGIQPVLGRLAFLLISAITLWLGWQNLADLSITQVFHVAMFWWLLALVWVFNPEMGKRRTLASTSIKILSGLLVLVPAWFAIIYIHFSGPRGAQWLIYALSISWVADTGAYFAGRRWGRHKLAPRVSPGKTVEGALGAIMLVAIYAALASLYFDLSGKVQWVFILFCIVLVPVSILGDLYESMIKRHGGIKDSGQILPGHGGVLDRIDSVTAVMPVFVLFASMAGLI